MTPTARIDPDAVIADLRELATLTSDDSGAQRVAFGPQWSRARAWLETKTQGLPVETGRDSGGNLWVTYGTGRPHLALGGHLDSVPDGGWLDGALGTVAGLHVLRALAETGIEARISLIDWADEEGRFGRALLGSGLVTGQVDPDSVAALADREGQVLAEVLGDAGLDIHRAAEDASRIESIDAYLELHIEQGPILEEMGLPLAAVSGSSGLERHAVTFKGRSSHAGSTPMRLRRDPVLAASRLALDTRAIVESGAIEVLATFGQLAASPGMPTVIPERCRMSLDIRSADKAALADAWEQVRRAAREIAAAENVELEWEELQRLDPVAFDPGLVDLCSKVSVAKGGSHRALVSGPLHDACSVASAGVPTAMIFVQSLDGISHSSEEDTKEDDLRVAADALLHAARLYLEREGIAATQ